MRDQYQQGEHIVYVLQVDYGNNGRLHLLDYEDSDGRGIWKSDYVVAQKAAQELADELEVSVYVTVRVLVNHVLFTVLPENVRLTKQPNQPSGMPDLN